MVAGGKKEKLWPGPPRRRAIMIWRQLEPNCLKRLNGTATPHTTKQRRFKIKLVGFAQNFGDIPEKRQDKIKKIKFPPLTSQH